MEVRQKYKGGRPKVDFRTASKENYEKFKQLHPGIDITFKQFEAIIRTWNILFMTYLCETGSKVKLPYGFGPLAVNKKKTQRTYKDKEGNEHIILPVDWNETRKNGGKKVYMFNHHTEGYRFKWFWFKNESKLKITDIWCFKPSKKSSQLITTYCNNTEKPYYQLYREWYKRK